MDVIELDAASNGTIEPVRDLIAHAALGSPGRRKVYIIDEVHMLGHRCGQRAAQDPRGAS